MARLGCGQVGAALVLRSDPSTIIQDLTLDLIVEATAQRRLNVISQATLKLDSCYDGIIPVPWRHALRLSWDGDWFWYGPIVNVGQDANKLGTIEAYDLMQWMKFRKIRADFTSIGAPVDVSTIFETLVAAGFAQDIVMEQPTVIANPTGILAERQVLITEHEYVYDKIDELATTGIDWTAIDTVIVCGDVDINVEPIGVVNEGHLVGFPTMDVQGDQQATFVTVIGEGSTLGIAQDAAASTEYGLLDLVETEQDILDDTSAAAAAETRLDLRSTAPLVLGEIHFSPEAPYTEGQLIPGVVMATSLQGPYVGYYGNLRCDSFDFKASGEEGVWHVTANAQPVGTQA